MLIRFILMTSGITSNDKTVEATWTIDGVLGAIMSVIFPLLDYLNPMLQTLGALGGLILLAFTIKHKIVQIKIDKKKLNKSDSNGDDE